MVVDLEKAPINSYQVLKVWDAAMDLAHETYKVTATFPTEEVYGLTAQLRRSAVSVPSAIAEGFGRGNRAARVKYLGECALKHVLDRAEEVGRMIRGVDQLRKKRRVEKMKSRTTHYRLTTTDSLPRGSRA